MLRSLNAKLIIAFVAVSLVGIVVVAGVTVYRTMSGFDNYLFDRWEDFLVEKAYTHYTEYGSWDGIDQALTGSQFYLRDEFAPEEFDPSIPMQGPPGRTDKNDRAMVLVSPENVALTQGLGYDIGDTIDSSELRGGTPIIVDDVQVATLIVRSKEPRTLAEIWTHGFLGDFARATLVGAAGAVVLALLVGVLLARSISRPVRDLTVATKTMATGDLGLQIPVRSQDELGVLAESFNKMSSDLANAENQRRQMTADIAHELRTPLSIILGHAEALQDGVLPATADTFGIIHDEATRLTHLIEDLRTLSLSDTGQLSLNREMFSVRTVLDRAALVHSPQALQREVSLNVLVSDGLPRIDVDASRMAQVLDNLLNNALRYTPRGGHIDLAARRDDDRVLLSVQDNGPGIPPDQVDHVFDRFYRGDKARHRQDGGSGLGLAIARSIVESHGSRIWAESEPGQGARFVIALPVVPDDAGAA